MQNSVRTSNSGQTIPLAYPEISHCVRKMHFNTNMERLCSWNVKDAAKDALTAVEESLNASMHRVGSWWKRLKLPCSLAGCLPISFRNWDYVQFDKDIIQHPQLIVAKVKIKCPPAPPPKSPPSPMLVQNLSPLPFMGRKEEQPCLGGDSPPAVA